MAKFEVKNSEGKKVAEAELAAEVYGIEPHIHVMHHIVKCQMASWRQGTQSAKGRAEVSGGGKKPWRQKGTGHARQGSIRAPQWTHGGVALGPKPRSYRYTINRKMKVVGLKSALSAKVAENELILVDAIKVDEYKTKTVVNMLKALGAEGKALIVTDTVNKTLVGSANNIPGVKTSIVGEMNTYDVLNSRKMILTVAAVDKLEEVYAK